MSRDGPQEETEMTCHDVGKEGDAGRREVMTDDRLLYTLPLTPPPPHTHTEQDPEV